MRVTGGKGSDEQAGRFLSVGLLDPVGGIPYS